MSDGKDTSVLDHLISRLKDNASFGNWIPSRGKFIEHLHELKEMIGNHKTKTQIAKQLITVIKRGKTNTFMLNTVLSGPPGVGKTRIATILAKIWISMGLLDSKPGESRGFDTSNISSNLTSMFSMEVMIIAIVLLIGLLYMAKYLYKFGGLYLLIGGVVFILVLAAYFFFTSRGNTTNSGKSVVRNVGGNEILKVVSREDFVDQWMGWTTKKTLDLLKANHGKVLFVDEAYSLIAGSHDQYGNEALTVLNKYLSENPNKIIVIFAGYKNKLRDTVFRAQPGLARRFMWHFDCPGYTIEELFSIFEKQLHEHNLILDSVSYNKIRKLFKDTKQFPAQAGDTERLVNYCETEHAVHKSGNLIDFEDVMAGLKELENNSEFTVEREIKPPSLLDLLPAAY